MSLIVGIVVVSVSESELSCTRAELTASPLSSPLLPLLPSFLLSDRRFCPLDLRLQMGPPLRALLVDRLRHNLLHLLGHGIERRLSGEAGRCSAPSSLERS